MPDLGPLSLLPVVVAIGLALWTRQVVVSLLSGVLVAALLLTGGDPAAALVQVVDPWILDAVASRDNAKVVIFSLLVAATIQVLQAAGGTRALVELVATRARDRRSGMVTTWLAGMVVFFDDYANCLIVGNSLRPLTDRLRISREKLAYLVDSTAAPMATVALISTWIGYEVGLIDQALDAIGRTDINAYAFFLEGLPYRFYPLLALVFAGAVAFTGRDFGPMRAAEDAALRREGAPVITVPPTATKVLLALVPVGLLVGVTALSLWRQGTGSLGTEARLFEIVGAADGYDAMLHGSIASLTAAALGALLSRSLDVAGTASAVLEGMSQLFEALVVLYLAWSLGSAIGDLQAADYLVGLLGDAIPAALLPTAVFVVAAMIAFATGTSFGTMAVLMPLVIPLAFAGDPASYIPLAATSSVLAGATWGDHCSPISDTTVLSSTGAGCDHAAHVSTQLPYAIAAGALSIALGTVPAGFGLPAWLCVLLGAVGCVLLVRFLGQLPEAASRPVESPSTASTAG